ncbi:hypothetical protein DFH27DRAFT_604373 [Peziza echinospora]|nr:hypothetical protein DFH27DRAFT_604373 [Peziza echinospora]
MPRLLWMAPYTHAMRLAQQDQALAATAFMETVGTVWAVALDKPLTAADMAALPADVFQQLAARIALGLSAFLAAGGPGSRSPLPSTRASSLSPDGPAGSSRSIASSNPRHPLRQEQAYGRPGQPPRSRQRKLNISPASSSPPASLSPLSIRAHGERGRDFRPGGSQAAGGCAET